MTALWRGREEASDQGQVPEKAEWREGGREARGPEYWLRGRATGQSLESGALGAWGIGGFSKGIEILLRYSSFVTHLRVDHSAVLSVIYRITQLEHCHHPEKKPRIR